MVGRRKSRINTTAKKIVRFNGRRHWAKWTCMLKNGESKSNGERKQGLLTDNVIGSQSWCRKWTTHTNDGRCAQWCNKRCRCEAICREIADFTKYHEGNAKPASEKWYQRFNLTSMTFLFQSTIWCYIEQSQAWTSRQALQSQWWRKIQRIH